MDPGSGICGLKSVVPESPRLGSLQARQATDPRKQASMQNEVRRVSPKMVAEQENLRLS